MRSGVSTRDVVVVLSRRSTKSFEGDDETDDADARSSHAQCGSSEQVFTLLDGESHKNLNRSARLNVHLFDG
jgi:hypothetical protein